MWNMMTQINILEVESQHGDDKAQTAKCMDP